MAAQLAASQEGLSSVSKNYFYAAKVNTFSMFNFSSSLCPSAGCASVLRAVDILFLLGM
jgi:hypothetical protein